MVTMKRQKSLQFKPMCDSKDRTAGSKWHKVLLRAVWKCISLKTMGSDVISGLVTRKYLCWIIMLGLMWTPLISNQKVYDKLLSYGVSLLRCFKNHICFFSILEILIRFIRVFYLFVYHFNYFKHNQAALSCYLQYCTTIISVSRTGSIILNRDFVPLKTTAGLPDSGLPVFSIVLSIS